MSEYDLVIIGGGPGGLTTAIYASRANISTAFIEKAAPGGKVVKTQKIENWTGDTEVLGPQLALRMFSHSKEFGAEYLYGNVIKIDSINENHHTVTLESGEKIKAKKIVIATGMVEVVPTWIKNVVEFDNRGVSYCAICDGPLYKGGNLAVMGGGNSAIEEAYYLTSIAKTVKVFVRNEDDLIAEKKLLDELKTRTNAEIILGSNILELQGNNKVEKMIVAIDGKNEEFDIDAFFPYIGQTPVSEFAKELDITNKQGYIPTDHYMETKVKGIFAVGDIREKEIRQIATAVADGAIAGKIIANKL